MAGLQLVVKIDDREVRDILRKVRLRASNATPAFKALGEHLVASTRKRFDTETAPDGTRWADISAQWRARKVKEGRSFKILTYKGRLRQSFVYAAGAFKLLWGTSVKSPKGFLYPAVFQLGGKFQQKRVFLGMSKADVQAALRIFKNFIRGEKL